MMAHWTAPSTRDPAYAITNIRAVSAISGCSRIKKLLLPDCSPPQMESTGAKLQVRGRDSLLDQYLPSAMARWNPDGTVDLAFDVAAGAQGDSYGDIRDFF